MDGTKLESLYFSAIGRSARAQQAIVNASNNLHPGYEDWKGEALRLELVRLDLEGAAADISKASKYLRGLK